MRVSVIVPTFRRPESLRACLAGLAAQTRQPTEVVVVRHRDDEATARTLAGSGPNVRPVVVEELGVVAAMQAAFGSAVGEILAVTDDDAVPRPDWVERIVKLFDDPTVGVVGGRDVIRYPTQCGRATTDVGRITAWGKLIGNHHQGTGGRRDVNVVKGVNLAVRQRAAALPSGLRGLGAQPHWEVALCQWARARGWHVVYDSDLVVDHYPAERIAGHDREPRSRRGISVEAYNLVAALLSEQSDLTWRRAAYGLAIGDRAVPGLLRAGYGLLRGDTACARRLRPSLTGQAAALRDHLRGHRLAMAPLEPTAQPLRVAVVAHDVHDGGGMERALARLVRESGRDVAFSVVSTSLAADLRPGVRWLRVRAPRRPFPLRFLVFYVRAGLRVRHVSDQLVHTCGAIIPNRVDLASVHFCHAGFVSSTGTLAPADGSPLRRANTALTRILSVLAERWTYRGQRARVLAAVSRGVRREIHRHYRSVPTIVTPNGVDSARFAPDVEARRQTRDEEEVSEAEVVALFVGGDWARKGLATAIEGLALTHAAGGALLRLWIVGPGDEEQFSAIAARAGIAGAVRFFGRRTDTERFYNAADMLVLPSLYEAHPLVVLEAAAAGLPLIITPVHGAVDLVGADEAGIIVESTPRSVAGAMARLAADPELRDRLGQAARDRATALSWDASVAEVMRVYQDLQASPEPPRGLSRVG